MSQAKITVRGRAYRRFIPFPQDVNDGTIRCLACGQIDELEVHDPKLCPACEGYNALAFLAAQKEVR